jgi:hypothetical protein
MDSSNLLKKGAVTVASFVRLILPSAQGVDHTIAGLGPGEAGGLG